MVGTQICVHTLHCRYMLRNHKNKEADDHSNGHVYFTVALAW